jgi:cytochrome c biogenesis protein CcmG/thiol:disulfide interchange protein DsbE
MDQYSRICRLCGWTDPNFILQTRAGKAGSKGSSAQEPPTHLIEYECNICHTPVGAIGAMCPNPNCKSLGPHRFRKTYDKAQLLSTSVQGTQSATSQQHPQVKAESAPQPSPAEPWSQLKESASKEWLKSKKLFEDSGPVQEKASRKDWDTWGGESEKKSTIKGLVIGGVIAILIIGVGVFNWGMNYNAPKTNSPAVTQPKPSPSKPSPAAATGLTIRDISVSDVTDSTAVITWTTSEPSSTLVDYGTTTSYGKTADISSGLVTSHKVQLSSLTPSTVYHYRIVSKNASGKTAVAPSDTRFTTAAPPDRTAPVIASISAVDVSDISATITWTTNEKATSQVEYGTSGSYGSITAMEEVMDTKHIVTVSGLEGEKTYYFRVKSKDANKNEAVSETNQTFKTLTPVPTGLEVGKRAPDFTVYDIDGDPVTLSRLRGKIVMINFWAIGCSACVAEMPDIEAVYKTWSGAKELKLLAINAGDHPIYVEKFIKEQKYTMPIFLDSDHDALSEYQISRIPRTYFIDSRGIIQKIELGRFDNQNQIVAALNSLQ